MELIVVGVPDTMCALRCGVLPNTYNGEDPRTQGQ
jgi:hypothetical protein